MELSKIHNLVGSSSREEKSVQGVGSFFANSFVYLQRRDKVLCYTAEVNHRRGFLCSQLPLLLWPSPPPKSPLSLGSSQGHTLCLLRRLPLSGPTPSPCFSSWAAWLHNHIHLFPKQLHAKVPLPRVFTFLRKTNEPMVWAETSAVWRFWDSHYFAACFPRLIVGAFKRKNLRMGVNLGSALLVKP